MQQIGYIRISSLDHKPDRQLGAQVSKVFVDKASGKVTQRPQFDAMFSFVREGDTLVVRSMDLLARNLDRVCEGRAELLRRRLTDG